MAEIVGLDPHPLGEDIIELLEAVIEDARKGVISAVCICTVSRDGSPAYRHSYLPMKAAMVGSLFRATQQIAEDE